MPFRCYYFSISSSSNEPGSGTRVIILWRTDESRRNDKPYEIRGTAFSHILVGCFRRYQIWNRLHGLCRKIGSLQMDQTCFLLRAYVPRYTAETREAYDASCDVFISVGYFCSWYKSTLSCHVFRLPSLSSLSRFLLLSVAHFDR